MNLFGDRVSLETAKARALKRKRLIKWQYKLVKAGKRLAKPPCKDPSMFHKRNPDDEGDQDGHQGGGGTSASIGIRAAGLV